MRGGTIAVVGGSIAGCAVARAAVRCGADEVVVFERAATELQDRGVGLGVNNERYAELKAAGFIDDAMPWTRLEERRWFARGDVSVLGYQLAVQPFPFRGYNWGSLWRELRRRVPEDVAYHPGAAVAAVVDGPNGAVVRLADGREQTFDLVIGADGYRSVVRDAVCPQAVPAYAGYLSWRGTFPAERLAELDGLTKPSEGWGRGEAVTIGISGKGVGGHLMMYRVPAGDDSEIVNWILYATPPPDLDLDLASPTSVPPGKMTRDLIDCLGTMADDQLPPYWAAVLRLTAPEQLFVQPIYDLEVPTYVGSRVLLTGDAAAVARPHSGAGAVKALQDAAVLETVWRSATSWAEVLERYDAERRPVGHAMVGMARRIGQAQVTDAPDWAAYGQAGFEAWWRELTGVEALGGRRLARA